MAKLSELPQATSLLGTEIIPIVVDSDNGTGKVNKVMDTTVLGLGIVEANNLINREELDTAISKCNQDTNDLTILLSTKSDSTHNHNELYADKLHTHNYVDIQGTPDLTVYVKNTQFEELSNSVLELESKATVSEIDIATLNEMILTLQETVVTLQGTVSTLEAKTVELENKVTALEQQLQPQS